MQFNVMGLQINAPNLKLTKRQQFICNYLSTKEPSSFFDYLRTFKGRHCGFNFKRVLTPDDGQSVDALANKGVNKYLKMALAKYDPLKDKSPSGIALGNALGIEIECIIPNDYAEDKYREFRKLIMDRKITNVNFKGDSSINDYDRELYSSVEVTIISDILDMSNLKKLCEVLDEIGAWVNKTCGLHVHLDCRDIANMGDITTRNLNYRANRLTWALPVLTKMLPASRLSNDRYCRYGKSKRGDRYYMVNTTSFSSHKTIEIRAHSGTTNYEKISQWATLLWDIMHCKGVRLRKMPVISDNASLLKALEMLDKKADLTTETKNYMLRRIKQFNPSLLEASNAEITDLEQSENQAVVVPAVEPFGTYPRPIVTIDEIPF